MKVFKVFSFLMLLSIWMHGTATITMILVWRSLRELGSLDLVLTWLPNPKL